jgi:hypothetical protein
LQRGRTQGGTDPGRQERATGPTRS